jgi:hypothetical protein
MKSLKLRIVRKSLYFEYYANVLAVELRVLGHTVEVCNALSLNRNIAQIVVGIHEFIPELKKTLSLNLYGIQTEHLPTASNFAIARANYNFTQINKVQKNLAHIFDWIPSNINFHKFRNHSFIPYGLLDLPKKVIQKNAINKSSPKLVFSGSVTPRRKGVLESLKLEFDITILKDVWGLDRLLKESQFDAILNIHADTSPVFEAPRYWESLAIGVPLITEFSDYTHPFTLDDHFSTVILDGPSSIRAAVQELPILQEKLSNTQKKLSTYNMTFVAYHIANRIEIENELLKSNKYRTHRKLLKYIPNFKGIYPSLK